MQSINTDKGYGRTQLNGYIPRRELKNDTTWWVVKTEIVVDMYSS